MYLDAPTHQVETIVDILQTRELDNAKPVQAVATLSITSGQGPQRESLALPMEPCQPSMSAAHQSNHLLRVLEISSITCKNGTFMIATNARLQEVTIIARGRECLEVIALVDDGASRNIMDVSYLWEVAETLGNLVEGEDLVGAGGNRLPTFGAWRGRVETGGIAKWGHWEVIDLGGAAKMILGRPWLRDIGAVHDYLMDVIHIKGEDGKR